uniref:C2H2-type domain-containing protein n=1 Tax=Trichogramma kaykai TaxID=54128 RepID=A0ABD2XB73_9HYME
MESSDTRDCAVRVKKKPIDALFNENDREMMEEKPDLENLQLLTFPPENTTATLQKCEENPGSIDELELVVECKDVKPNVNLLTIKKIDDDSPNLLCNVKDGSDYKTIIKIGTPEQVKQEFFDDVGEESNVNIDRELFEQNKNREIPKRQNKKHNLKNYTTLEMHDKTQVCKICEKKFATKGSLKRHSESSHHGITYSCDICRKTFKQKSSLKYHIDTMHNGFANTCDTCGKSFSSKFYLKIHIDTMHNGFANTCIQRQQQQQQQQQSKEAALATAAEEAGKQGKAREENEKEKRGETISRKRRKETAQRQRG